MKNNEKFKELRFGMQVTTKELAVKLGVAEQTIKNWLYTDTQPSNTVLILMEKLKKEDIAKSKKHGKIYNNICDYNANVLNEHSYPCSVDEAKAFIGKLLANQVINENDAINELSKLVGLEDDNLTIIEFDIQISNDI